MPDDKTQFWIWGAIITAVTGLYALFVKHVYGHVAPDDIKTLKQDVQYKDNCKQIVKRLDENHEEVCKKLDRIFDKLDGDN